MSLKMPLTEMDQMIQHGQRFNIHELLVLKQIKDRETLLSLPGTPAPPWFIRQVAKSRGLAV